MRDSTSLSRMSTDFGKRIKAARKHADLTQVELSKAIGIKQSSLSHLESTAFCSTHTTQIAKACKVDPNWLATGEGEMLQRTTPDQAVAIASSTSGGFTLVQALEVVAGALLMSDDLTLDQVRPLLARLVDEPPRASEIVPRIAALLSTTGAMPGTETHAFAGRPARNEPERTI